MRALVIFLATTVIGLAGPVIAQTSARTLEQRLKSIDPKTLTAAHCALQIEKAASANGPELIYGARVCDAVGKPVESSFLSAVGQLRAMSDVLLLPPATKSDDQSLLPLYGILYFGGGTAGVKDEVLREQAARDRFLILLNGWRPTYSPAYDPGWSARKRPDAAKYQSSVAQSKLDLRALLNRVIRLVSDDEYYALYRQRMQILERHPKGLEADTPEGKLADDLEARIRHRMIALGEEVGPSESELASDAEKSMSERQRDFPPLSPAKDETVLAAGSDPTSERCLDLAERSAVSHGGKIVRVLVTSSRAWGTIWRADISGGDQPPSRFSCTEGTSSSSPLDQRIPPLPVKLKERQ